MSVPSTSRPPASRPSGEPAARGLPLAGVDPIDDATALRVLQHARSSPARPETLALFVDRRRTGSCIAVVSGTTDPDQVVDVVDTFARVCAGTHDLVVASVRLDTGLVPSDADRWLEMSDLVAEFGVELLEWYVLGDEVFRPRDLLADPPRWQR